MDAPTEDHPASQGPPPSDVAPSTRTQRLARYWDSHATRLIVAGGLALGLLAGLALWHRSSSGGTGGTGHFLFDVVVLGLLVGAPLAMLALALINWAVGFLGGICIILVGDFLYLMSTRRNGEAAHAGDVRAQARIDHWKRWQKKWTR
jgi:hypothetical protein